jgi:predicted HTH domain antitoxin
MGVLDFVRAMQVKLELPDAMVHQWGDTPAAVARRLLEDAAIEGYRTGRLSHRQVGTLLGLDYWQAEGFLRDRRVPLNYSSADLQADAKALAKILGSK